MSEIMMATPLVPMVLSGEKTQTRRTGERWLKVKPGDVLAMREAFCARYVWPPTHEMPKGCAYRADWSEDAGVPGQRWTPAVHMPLELVRVHLHVVRVWQERVSDISEADARAEGMASLTAEGLLELGGSRRKIWKKLTELDWGGTAQLCAAYGWDWMAPDKRFHMVAGVLGAKPGDVVMAIEFKAVRV